MCCWGSFFFFQAEGGIRDLYVTEFRRVLFRSCAGLVRSTLPAFPATRRRSEAASGLCLTARSEERRVGKECRSRWSPYQEKKTETTTHMGTNMGAGTTGTTTAPRTRQSLRQPA